MKSSFCKRGHDKDLMGRTSNGGCKTCMVVTGIVWYSKNKCRAKAATQASVARNPQRNKTNHDEARWRRMGVLTREGKPFLQSDYDEAFKLQKGLCKLITCRKPPTTKVLYVEHNHINKKFRGLVCRECNLHIIGSNTLETIKALQEYFS